MRKYIGINNFTKKKNQNALLTSVYSSVDHQKKLRDIQGACHLIAFIFMAILNLHRHHQASQKEQNYLFLMLFEKRDF